ncbi:MAG TPA: hypothetical protein VGK67_28950 [Myxococcales bacterium]|jgi:hypothetical protein
MFAVAVIACLFLGGSSGPTGLDVEGALRRMDATVFAEPGQRPRLEEALRSLAQESRRYASLRARALRELEQLEARPGPQRGAEAQLLSRLEREEGEARASVLAARERLRVSLTAEEWQALFAPATTPGASAYPSPHGS